MIKRREIKNITFDLNGSMGGCVSWQTNDARYHVWDSSPATIYKNPPLGVKVGEDGYFHTRRLNAANHFNTTAYVRTFVEREGLREKAAVDQAAKDEAERVRNEEQTRLIATAKETFASFRVFLEGNQGTFMIGRDDIKALLIYAPDPDNE